MYNVIVRVSIVIKKDYCMRLTSPEEGNFYNQINIVRQWMSQFIETKCLSSPYVNGSVLDDKYTVRKQTPRIAF